MEKFKNIGILGRFIISFIIIIMITIVVMSTGFYYITRMNIVQLIQKDFYHLLQKNNQIIDNDFLEAQEISKKLITDPVLYAALNDYHDGEINILKMERSINEVLSRNQFYSQGVVNVFMATSYFIFGENRDSFTFKNIFPDADMFQNARSAKGAMVYTPGSDIFSASCVVNSSYTEAGLYHFLKPEIEKPILVINYDAKLYEKCFEDLSFLDHAENLVIDAQQNIIYYNHMEKKDEMLNADWLDEMAGKKTGSFIGGKGFAEYVVCFDQSAQTGWYVITKIPLLGIINENLEGLGKNLAMTILAAVFSAAFISIFLSQSITKPINNLIAAISKSSKGEFHHKVELLGTPETRLLLNEYNAMNQSLKILIDENYKIKLKEKDAVIKSLHNQLNPHFLYNTLNCINWLAIESDNHRVSEMIVNLSEILQYTISVNGEIPFEDEFKWLCQYIDIMSVRFENMFTFSANIEPAIFKINVMKLCLQPVIENIFVHGFKDKRSGGEIKFNAFVNENGVLNFVIEDNGCGIEQERLDEIFSSDPVDKDKLVGIRNTDKRIKLMYGENYGIFMESGKNRGTKVTIHLKI